MRIGDPNPPPVQPPEPSHPPDQGSEEALREAAQSRTDEVELSRLSQALAEAGSDAARLEQIRLHLESGAYRVSAADLARRIVGAHLSDASDE